MDSLELRRAIRGCTRCPLHSLASGPVPPTLPDPPSRILIVGEAPGRSEDRQLRPFVGPAGTLARKWLAQAGVNPDEVAWANTVSCWPQRTPNEEEIRACKPNLDAVLEHVDPAYILLFGSVALGAVLPGKRIGEFRGTWFRRERAWVMATYHPAAILRNRNLERIARGDVAEFGFYSLGVFEPVAGEVGKGKRKKYWQQERLI